LFLVPQIRFLDYQKVKDTERVQAREIFGTLKAPTEAAKSILAASANASTSYIAPLANGAAKQPKVKLNEKERARFEALIKNAKSLAEITRLEKDLSEGRTPAGVLDEDVMDET
jgi:U2 small nuclear ribonucleoprotein A'